MIPFFLAAGLASAPALDALTESLATAMCQKASAGLKDMRWDRDGTRPAYVRDRLSRCSKLLLRAHREGVSYVGLARILGIAYAETNFRPRAVGSSGERGMMQIIPLKHCHLAGGPSSCDYDLAGIRFFKSLVAAEVRRAVGLRRRFSWTLVLWRYNGGRAYALKVEAYARTVLYRWRR